MPPVNQIRVTQEQERPLLSWIADSIDKIQRRRDQRRIDWRRWREQYEGKVPRSKNFPWPNASNVHVPITSIIVDAIHANMMNRIFGHERVWDITAFHPTDEVGINLDTAQPITWTDLAASLQRYVNFEASPSGSMDVYAPVETAILECVKLGTAVLHNPFTTLVHEDFRLDHATGEIHRREPTTEFEGIRPRAIPLDDFEILPHYTEIHGPEASPLLGHRYWLRRGEIISRFKQGWYRSKEHVASVLNAPGTDDQPEDLKDAQTVLERDPDNVTDLRRQDFALRDLWVRFPLLKSIKTEVRLFLTYHHKSRTIMRIQPFIYKTPPYVALRYIQREGRFYGIGVPEMLETIQRGVNTSFNQAVDNATIANMRVIKARRQPYMARTLENLFPGKKLFLDNMDDVQDFQLGEVYPSIFQVGLLLRDFAERRTGITDFNLGRESEVLGRASTATTTMALLQEGARRFDLYAKDIRRGIGELGMQSLELIQQHRPTERIHITMGAADGEKTERAIGLPQEVNLRQHFAVVSTSSASSSNKEVARQNALTAFGILSSYMERIFNLGMLMVNPETPQPLRQLAYAMSQTGERLMQRVLEGFDLPDIASQLPQMEGLLNVPGAAQGAGQQPGVESPGGVPAQSQGGNGGAAAPGAAGGQFPRLPPTGRPTGIG